MERRRPLLPFTLAARRRPVQVDVDDEFAFHLDLRTRELVARGWTPEAARQEALRQFGDLEDARTYCRHLGERKERRLMWRERLQVLRHDVTLAVRTLRRTPGFTLAAAVTLALGVGATVTMVGLVDELLFRPPAGIHAPAELRRVYVATSETNGQEEVVSFPTLEALREAFAPGGRTMPAVAAYTAIATAMGQGEQAEDAQVTLASGEYFALLGVRAAVGRLFGRVEDTPPSGQRVAVLSWDAWQRRFGGDPAVVGRTVRIAGLGFEVVGVAPRGFNGTDPTRVDAWVPLSALANSIVGQFAPDGWERAHEVSWLHALVRVGAAGGADGTLAAANTRATGAWRGTIEQRRGAAEAGKLEPRATLEPLLLERGPDRTPVSQISLWLAGMSVVVLAIACANVANLLLARAIRRGREHAVRVALGAARWRLGMQTLTESLVLALLGGAGAMLVVHWGGAVLRRVMLPGSIAQPLTDGRTIAAAGLIAVLAGLLTGLGPTLHAVRAVPIAAALRSDARGGGGRRSATRNALVVLQATLSLVLLAGAGLFARSLHRAVTLDLGYAPEQALSVQVELPGESMPSRGTLALYDRLRERIAAMPGVRAAGLTITEPYSTSLSYDISLPGRDSIPMPATGSPKVNAVTPEYFAAMGTAIVRGRGITDEDVEGGAPVVVINETMARFLFPNENAIGRCVVLREVDGKPCAEVVGIARDVRWSELRNAPPMQMYFALRQELLRIPIRALLVRGTGDPSALVASIRRVVLAEAPTAVRVRVRPLAVHLDKKLRPWRLGATTLVAFGGLALLLAALGLYAVIAYDVAQRVREIGVRQALGARARDVARLVIAQGLRVAGLGVLLGVGVALLAGRWIGPLLFETTPYDPAVLGGVAALLLLVAALAAAVPALRASRLPPATALRAE